jgi:hypothetical protein
MRNYLVRLMGGSGGNLALLARGELGEVAVVVTLPVHSQTRQRIYPLRSSFKEQQHGEI